MVDLKTLIDKAAVICGTQIKLGEALQLHRSELSEMKHGKRNITPEIAVLLADITHTNVREAAMSAILECTRKTKRFAQIEAVINRPYRQKLVLSYDLQQSLMLDFERNVI